MFTVDIEDEYCFSYNCDNDYDDDDEEEYDVEEDDEDDEEEEEEENEQCYEACGISSSDDESTPNPKKRKLSLKENLMGIEALQVFFCCALFCLCKIPCEDLELARSFYQEKTKQERSQYIVDYLTVNNSQGTRSFYIGTQKVCLYAWRMTLGIPESSFYKLKNQVEEGKRVVNASGQTPGYTSKKTQMAFVWLRDLCNAYAGSMPDSSQMHLPCCMTKSSVYEMMKDDLKELKEECVSRSHFFRIWRTSLQYIAIPKKSRFSECTTCALIKKALSETKDKDVRADLFKQRRKHLCLQRMEREKYYKHQTKAKKHPDQYLSLIIDGMDQSRTRIPHFVRNCKAMDCLWKMKVHLVGVKVHGVGIYGFFDLFQWPHGSNLSITVLINVFSMLKDNLPDVLYLQMDNCWRENKNRYVLAFLCLLVEKNIFRKIKLSFLVVGHTHEDIDQLFSRFSNWLNHNNAVTQDDLMKGFESCYNPCPTAIDQTHVFDFASWIDPHLNMIRKHSNPHVFKIVKCEGKAKIQCKKWTTDKEWLDCAGSEENLIKTLPSGVPQCLPPMYNELDRTQNSIGCVKAMMTTEQQQWWETYLQEKENEELEFSDKYIFPIEDIVKAKQESREKQSTEIVEAPQIVHDDDQMEPVVIGKLLKNNSSDGKMRLEEGRMVLTNVPHYHDEWPQVGRLEKKEGNKFTVLWFRGSVSGSWTPCTVPVPGQRGKRQPWTEVLTDNLIIYADFNLTHKGCLPKRVKAALPGLQIKFL